jgi:predicted oxidoreductase
MHTTPPPDDSAVPELGAPGPLPPIALPHSGVRLSRVVAGVWRMAEWGLNVQQRVRWIEQALELGITTFDHADIYGGYTVEGLFGQALAASPGLRQRLQLVSKCGIKLMSPQRPAHALKSYDTSSAHVQASVENSLRELRTDHLDVLLTHRPDALMHPDELARCFERLRAQGKVRAFGVSNHAPSTLAMLHRRFALSTHQVEFSPLQMQALADGTLEQCLDLGLPPMAWSPLGGGRLFTGPDEQAQRVRAVLQALALEHGVSPASLALAWVMRHPAGVLPLTGSGRPEALREAAAALSVQLPAEHWWRVWQASMGQEVP